MNIHSNSYLLVNLDTLRSNISAIISELPSGCSLIPVLKDDAYGTGLRETASVISEFDEITCISVAHVSEGLVLRDCGWRGEVLVLGNPAPGLIPAALDASLTLTLACEGAASAVRACGTGSGKKSARVQIEIDSGLHRTGFSSAEELEALAGDIAAAGDEGFRFEVTGIYSHFSDPSDSGRCALEYRNYTDGLKRLGELGITAPLRHISSSASFEAMPEYSLGAVRIGRRLYMDSPVAGAGRIKEIASWRAAVTGVYRRKAGDALGYCGRTVLDHDATVAVIGAGYGDGLNEALVDARAPVLVGGKRCPLLACFMDQAIVDVTGTSCAPGDEATLFGYDGRGGFLSSQEVAFMIGGNEGCGLTAALSPRVERIYTGKR